MTRKLNALELRVHQAALANPEKVLTQKELVVLAPDVTARTEALNFLLGTGMLKALTRANGLVSGFRAVLKKELDVKKDMSGEEEMVLSHIQAAANKGIWTKHLKAKTELHQTVIDRCLKSLLQKQLVKVVKSVEHRTRKMYMLSHLEPAVELTGGPWYTDNELDSEFIKNLYDTILHYIKERSFPKHRPSDGLSAPVFPITSAPSYPTASQIQAFVSKSKITDTRLTVDHVEMLLNILVLDGELEKIPAFGAALWESNINLDEDEDEEVHRKKRKRKTEKEKDQRKRKRRKHVEDTDIDSNSDDESKHKKSSKKRRNDDAVSTSDSDNRVGKKGKKKRKLDDSDQGRRKGKKSKKASHVSSESSSRSSASASESDSEDDTRSRRSQKPSRKRPTSPVPNAGISSATGEAFGGTHVYRAIRQERVVFGWSQAPCSRCPVSDFCKEKGPVNPKECNYFDEWFRNEVVSLE